jgi:hypothetical protein
MDGPDLAILMLDGGWSAVHREVETHGVGEKTTLIDQPKARA